MTTDHVIDEADRDALRAKYRAERAKRIRPEGNDQYIEPTGRFAHFLDDPYVTQTPREPINRDVNVAIVGAGFAGLTSGARLRQAGVEDIWLIDGAGDVGGAWYWNRYPGAMCDTAAMIYLPLLEETGYRPSMKYVPAAEIFAHAQRIATTFNLYENALFSTAVSGLTWDEDSERWHITTSRGDLLRARFVLAGTGPLHRPKLPGIEGLETFEGHCFHTSRWDYAYTGGSRSGEPMTLLADKRVGIVGTGATGVQCIPHIARAAGDLFVFQRTPSSIDVRNNAPIDPAWYDALPSGWQYDWLTNFATLQTGGFANQDYVMDGWTDISIRIRDRVVANLATEGLTPEAMRKAYEESDDEKMAEIRARVSAIVRDPATAEGLKPWYRQLCKRPCFHDEYLDAYNRDNVHLVDTDGRGVERVDATGVWVGDTHYPLDCLIFASGFEVGTEYARRAGFETIGRDGETLSDHWSKGMTSLHGLNVAGFPNFFLLGFAQAGNLFSNVTHNFVESGTTTAAIIRHALSTNATRVEVDPAAEEAWVALVETAPTSFLFDPECTPGYYNNEGQEMTTKTLRQTRGYPEGPVAFFSYIDRWRTSGDFTGLRFS